MKKVDYNIEFAHIYVNEAMTNEHYTAAALAQKEIQDLKSAGKSVVTSVLIDDYNPTESILNVKKFIEELESVGVTPDYIVMESALASYRDIALSEMNGKVKKMYSKYLEKNEKCPCSFLVAIWHLLRLGALDNTQFISETSRKPFSAENVITILPERYRGIEKRALDIIKSTKFAPLATKTNYIYF